MSLQPRVTLGSVIFHGWTGWTPTISKEGEAFVRLGQSGSGSQVTGSRSGPKACKAWIGCISLPDALAQVAAVEALAWTTVKMVSQWGTTDHRARVRVTGVSCDMSKGAGTKVTASAAMAYLILCQISIEVLP